MYSDSLHYHKQAWAKDPENDLHILKSIWKMMDEADYVVAHNVKFDVPTLNSRFLQMGMKPPSSFKTIDTLQIAKSNFRFTSNKLQFLADKLTDDAKMDPGGFSTWMKICRYQDTAAFDTMMEYNCQDVWVLEEVYNILKPWAKTHPSLPVSGDLSTMRCNVCESTSIKKNGHYNTQTQKYQKFRCNDCGHSMRSRSPVKTTKEQKNNLLRSI